MVAGIVRTSRFALAGAALALGAGVLLAAWFAAPSSAPVDDGFMAYQLTDEDRAPDRFLVRFRSGLSSSRIAAINAAHDVERIGEIPDVRISILQVPEGSTPEKMIDAYSADSSVDFAEGDWVYRAAAVPNANLLERSAAPLRRIGAPDAWQITTGSGDVRMAMLDTGIDAAHPDFAGRVSAGYDFASNDNDASDDHGHGTASAGIAAATGDNGVGIAGMDWRCTIIPLKVLDAKGMGHASDIARALVWASDRGIEVIALGMAGPHTDTLDSAVAYALESGAVLVAPAGDDGYAEVSYPAASPGVIAVGATQGDELAYFSNCGPDLDICAPGVSIQTTAPRNSRTVFSGTSAAAPFVAGLATLILAQDPALPAGDVAERITRSAQDLGDAGFDDIFGWGRIDAAAALGSRAPRAAPAQ